MEAILQRIGSDLRIVLFPVGAFAVIAFIAATLRIRAGQEPRRAVWTTGVEVLIAGSLALIAIETLSSFAVAGAGQLNLIPFQGLASSFSLGDFWIGIAVTDLIGNFLLYVPLGLGVGLRFRQLSPWVWPLLVFGLSLAIEVVQFTVLNRSADVTDVLMNGLGGVAGFLVARLGLAFAARLTHG